MTVAHFYHCFCSGRWQEPLSEHLAVLTESGFDGAVTVGLVGSRSERRLPRRIIQAVIPDAGFVEADDGFEQVTLRALAENAQHDGLSLYAHTKGAAHPSDLTVLWRQSMTLRVVSAWQEHVPILEEPWVDAVGCHWLIPGRQRQSHDVPHFAGNFWMARNDYLRRLPDLGEHRFDAERWIGIGRPSVVDLIPGVPSVQACLPPVSVSRLQVHVDGALAPTLD